MFNKIKQFKNLRDQAKQLKEQLAEETVKADWKDKINMVMDGNQKILSVDISPEMLNPDKKEDLEKGIKACLADAIKKSQMAAARKMQGLGGLEGMNLPGM
ncbi:MAG: YbaB/EbfC family nucleoid-associated protein [Patescibacteria group bacterium]|nr:YbaB/EbfC family nucleoid-associated protein [Patescibacteria group bacterium]